MCLKIVASFLLAWTVGGVQDLQRARAKVPRDPFRADHSHRLGKVLNEHLLRAHPNARPCIEWSPPELQQVQAKLYAHRESAYDRIYSDASDTRALRLPSIKEHQSLWNEVEKAAAGNKLLMEMQRDGHCRETIMWWTHHLSERTRQLLQNVTLPTLPSVEWREPIPEESLAAAVVYQKHYNPSSTCLACHGGGIPWQDPDVQPPPIPRQVNGKDRQRRCDEWYGAEEGGACGPCEGMAGAYYGDMPDEGIYPECEVVANASDVPVASRAPRTWPRAFSVEMRGADRWPRASASGNKSCNFTTDCSPYSKEAEGQPLPPTVPLHWYAQIHGVLYLDHKAGQFGGGRLRHETVYQFPSGIEGAKRALQGLNGEKNVHLTEIHVQTPQMASAGDPGVMLNLEHDNMTQWNASGHDDSKADWRRIPSTDGTCVCVADPAGLPYFEGAYNNATYLGRVRFIPPWQKTGSYGPPDGKPVVADHYVKWVFHLFVDIATKRPVMFSSPYGGTATYGNWTDAPGDLWPQWTENPPRDKCFAVTSAPSCAPYVQPSIVPVVV